MKLYYSPGSCALAPHIVLREVGGPFELEKVDLKAHQTAGGGDFYRINSKGSVPVLEIHGGERLTEGPVICQYIADQAQRTDLMPAPGSLARYRVMEWQNFITSEVHKSFSPLFKPDVEAATKAYFRALLLKRYAWISSSLEGKHYLTGESFTAADAYLFAVTRWAKSQEVDLASFQPVQAFMQRVREREAVSAALEVETRSQPVRG
jgi:glutathione S-transferase